MNQPIDMIRVIPKPYHEVYNMGYRETAVLKLEKAHFAGIPYSAGKMVLAFEFCLFNKLIIENEEALDFEEVSISFLNTYIRELEIKNIADNKISVSLASCIFSGNISASKLSSVQVNNCLLVRGLFLLGLPNIRISYTTENIFPFWWNQLFKRTGTGLSFFSENEQRYHIESPVRLVVTSSKKSDDKPGYYLIEHNTSPYHIGYHLSGARENALKFSLFVKYSGDVDESTQIENVNLHALSLTGNPNGKVAVENTRISNWYLSEFSPKTEAGFYNITPYLPSDEPTLVGIHQCNLDKVWFDNVDFESFQRLSFYRSKFSNAIFTACSFPDAYEKFSHFMPIANIHYPENKTVNYDKDQYEIFLQLKKAMDATGNNYESLKMQAVSQSALRKIKSISSADRFILRVSKFSNEHGQSISRPFWLFMAVSISGYVLYLSTLGLIFQPTEFNPNLIGYYFSFIDITHRSDFLVDKKSELNGWALATDYFVKLLLGYLIVQFVAAFRKYVRK
jgi:hypothetical protein